jgi:hypothetical protein
MNKLISYLLGTSMMCSLVAQVEPGAGKWKTWVIPSGSALRLPAPPDGEATTTELQWVKECVPQRDPATLAAIRYWDAGAPAYRWMQVAEQYVVGANLPGPLQTRALALVAVARCWGDKWDKQSPPGRRPTGPTDIAPSCARDGRRNLRSVSRVTTCTHVTCASRHELWTSCRPNHSVREKAS